MCWCTSNVVKEFFNDRFDAGLLWLRVTLFRSCKHPKVWLKVSLRWYPIITIPTCSLDIYHTSVHVATENLLTFHCPGATFSQKVLIAKTYRQYCYTVHSDEACLPVYNSVSKHAVDTEAQSGAPSFKYLLVVTVQSPEPKNSIGMLFLNWQNSNTI